MSPVKPDSANRANSSVTLRLCISCLSIKKGRNLPNGRKTPLRRCGEPSVMQNLGQEQLSAFRARLPEKIILQGVLDDLAAVHEDDAVRNLPRKAHLVRDHHHGHAFLG